MNNRELVATPLEPFPPLRVAVVLCGEKCVTLVLTGQDVGE